MTCYYYKKGKCVHRGNLNDGLCHFLKDNNFVKINGEQERCHLYRRVKRND